MPKYIIEHLEPEIYPWCLIEYKNISKIVGKDNLWFTNIAKKSKESKNLENLGKVFSDSVARLCLKNACILDPEAEKTLSPKEAGKFNYFIFGGILGDYPPKKRTTPELTSKIRWAEARNLGKKQFSTDNAVLVVKELVNGKNLNGMKFLENLVIPINKVESIELPYCYPIINGKPQISKALVKFLKSKKTF